MPSGASGVHRRLEHYAAACMYARSAAVNAVNAEHFLKEARQARARAHAVRCAADCIGEATQLYAHAGVHALAWLLS